MSVYNPESIRTRGKAHTRSYKKLYKRLQPLKNAEVNDFFSDAHEKTFECIDCLKCANCCKTTGPRFIRSDIKRIASFLQQSENEFQDNYLRLDEDGDWILQSTPCPFLESDNKCSVYDVRPKACASFPHTNDHDQKKITGLTLKNAQMCPAVQDILERVSAHI